MFTVRPRLSETNLAKRQSKLAPQYSNAAPQTSTPAVEEEPADFDPDEDLDREKFSSNKPTKEQQLANESSQKDSRQMIIWFGIVLLIIGLIGLIVWMVIQQNKPADDQLSQYMQQQQQAAAQQEWYAAQQMAAAQQQMAAAQQRQMAAAQQRQQRGTHDTRQTTSQPDNTSDEAHVKQTLERQKQVQHSPDPPSVVEFDAQDPPANLGHQAAGREPLTNNREPPQKSTVDDILNETAGLVANNTALSAALSAHTADLTRAAEYDQ
jgi:cytoskeletal protein RodZ